MGWAILLLILIQSLEIHIMLWFSGSATAEHRVTHDLTFRGYDIKRNNCSVIANLYAVHYDPNTFPQPEKFRPDRFIDVEGGLIKNDSVIPFGMGKYSWTSIITSLSQRNHLMDVDIPY